MDSTSVNAQALQQSAHSIHNLTIYCHTDNDGNEGNSAQALGRVGNSTTGNSRRSNAADSKG